MSTVFFEARPLYTGEDPYTCTATVQGSGDLSGTFTGSLYDPDGDEVEDAVTVVIASASDRTLTVTIDGQDDPGTYRLLVREDGTGVVVVKGDLEITDPTRRSL